MNDDYGDEAELNYIIEQGQLEAEQFGTYGGPFWKGKPAPAKWLNPPHPIWILSEESYDSLVERLDAPPDPERAEGLRRLMEQDRIRLERWSAQ
jgi:hypothetical protein